METKLEDNGIIRKSRIDVPHLEEIITFGLPLVGPDCYQEVMGKISQEGMLRPTTAQTFLLIDWALRNPDEEHSKSILSRFRNDVLLTSTESLFTPNEIIVYDNIYGNMPSDRESLLKRAKDGDKSVRVVNYGLKNRFHSVSDLVKHPYIIAQVGNKDFAEEVVARVASAFDIDNPYGWDLTPEFNGWKHTSMYAFWGGIGFTLNNGKSRDGYVAGVCKKSAEGTTKNK